MIFRHGASLGGFNVLALLLQEGLNLRAGYVQMGLDVSVILLALFVVAPATVLLSAVGPADTSPDPVVSGRDVRMSCR